MGTNYHAMAIPTQEVKEEMIKAVIDENWNLLDLLIPAKVHIGKSSGGWVFHFNHNNWKYFSQTRNSINEFLKKCQIIDEYDRTIHIDDFWELVKMKENHGKSDASHCEIHDGLEFSTSTEFS